MSYLNIKNEAIADSSDSRPESRFNYLYQSPAKLVLIIAFLVFISEYLTMVIIAHIPGLSAGTANVIDSVLLVIFLIPAFMLFIFRPLLLQITVRKNAETELTIERNKLKGILDAMPDGVYIVNRQYEIEYFNSALEHEYGPVNGCKCYEYAFDRTEPCTWCNKSEVFAGRPVRGEWHSSRTDKTYELFERSILNFDGSVSKLKILHDITERKRALVEVRDSREQLRNLSAHLQAAREEERTAIAREIHDELGQVLATLQLDISWLVGELHEDQHLLVEKAEAMSGLIVNTVKTVQEISSKLRPVMLDELGLADAMEWQAKEFQKRSGISCDFAVELASKSIDRDISTALYRIFQETLTNVLRHAGATRVEGSLTEKKERIVLMIRDNGRGITREQINNPISIGLIGMQERTRMLGGRTRIRGVDRKGSAIVVQIPITRKEG